MKYRFSKWPYKLLAFVLAAVMAGMAFASGIVTIYCIAQNYYDDEQVFQTTYSCKNATETHKWSIIDKYRTDPAYDRWDRLLKDTCLRFIIVEEKTGEVKAAYLDGLGMARPKNLKNNLYMTEYSFGFEAGEPGSIFEYTYVHDYYFGDTWSGDQTYVYDLDGVSYQLLLLLPKTIQKQGSGDQLWENYRIYATLRQYRTGAPIAAAVCLLGFLAAAVFLLFQSGHRPGENGIRITWFERIPLELHLILCGGAIFGAFACLVGTSDLISYPNYTADGTELLFWLLACGVACCVTAVLGALVSFAARMKAGSWWNGLLCWRILRWIFRKLHGITQIVVQGFRSFAMVPRALLLILVIGFLEILGFLWLANTWAHALPVIYLTVLNLFLLLAFVWAVAQMQSLRKAAKSLADGDLTHQTDTSNMYWDFKTHGEHLNAIAGGLNKAVEKQMRSERLKTELITNVSHDIKTPLTSIINYVDLLQKPHTETEEIQYLEVLDRQARRLKKLTENLVEASKASTGNMAVHAEPTSVTELINQSLEEYRERLEAGKLSPVVELQEQLTVMADGKLMWRVLDNLLNNVVKYAMPGTRVYVTARRQGEQVILAVKNISRDSLNTDAEELMERFVRGDSSRHTEGTGLGLNIARSLTLLQKGSFDLTVDGDFFKAEITLPVA